ncbi:MAG: hypothetical protein HOQ02_06275 [Lysobacter sp.]|nr:hypothetical protein [Lysobacter sp.]
MAVTIERRSSVKAASSMLKRELNAEQVHTLHTLERFGWELKFIRRSESGGKLAVLFDPDARRYAVLGEDGELDENPVFHQFR